MTLWRCYQPELLSLLSERITAGLTLDSQGVVAQISCCNVESIRSSSRTLRPDLPDGMLQVPRCGAHP